MKILSVDNSKKFFFKVELVKLNYI